MIDYVNSTWHLGDPLWTPAYYLWRFNHIHPFVNGNGRTARALCYFILCVNVGGWLGGPTISPELIRNNRGEYVRHLRSADKAHEAGNDDFADLHTFLRTLLLQQINDQPRLFPYKAGR